MTATVRAARARFKVFDAARELGQYELAQIYRARLENPVRRAVRIVVAPARFQPCVPDMQATPLVNRATYGGLILTYNPHTDRWCYEY